MCLGTCHSSLHLCPASWGKVVSAVLGMPPPNLDAHGIGQSSATDHDEESILSDSHLDRHFNTVDSSHHSGTSTPCAAQIKNRNHGPLSAETKMDTSLATRTMTKIVTKGNVRNPKRAITNMVQIGLTVRSPWHKDHDSAYKCGANGKHKRSHRHDSPSDSHKTKQRRERRTQSITCDRRKSHTPECRPLPASTHVPFNTYSHASQTVF